MTTGGTHRASATRPSTLSAQWASMSTSVKLVDMTAHENTSTAGASQRTPPSQNQSAGLGLELPSGARAQGAAGRTSELT